MGEQDDISGVFTFRAVEAPAARDDAQFGGRCRTADQGIRKFLPGKRADVVHGEYGRTTVEPGDFDDGAAWTLASDQKTAGPCSVSTCPASTAAPGAPGVGESRSQPTVPGSEYGGSSGLPRSSVPSASSGASTPIAGMARRSGVDGASGASPPGGGDAP